MNNLKWARILIDQLIKQGVNYFCISPGSRSTPLVIAIAEHPQAMKMVHFDERGTAFHAVGYGKATGKAAAILVTSGTAVGNLLPALMEASNECIPLIVLTADRPPERRDCGASQTCDQIKLFSPYVRFECDLPCPSEEIPERFLATTTAQAVFAAHGPFSGPVHLNCPFRKPLFSDDGGIIPDVVPLRIEQEERALKRASMEACARRLMGCKEGLILVGSMDCHEEVAPILELGEQLQFPVITDILSQIRTLGKHPCLIPYFHMLLKEFKPKMVLHFGNRIVSKTIKDWLNALAIEEYIQVSDHPHRQDPHHQTTWRFVCNPAVFCETISGFIGKDVSTDWLHSWQERAEHIGSALSSVFREQTALTEPGIVYDLTSHLLPDCSLFIANSMPIRDADLFLFPDQPIGSLFGNRGVSGIDGNIATATGIAMGKKQPVIALLGDLTTLHDLNSLAQLKDCPYPVLIVVINNQGGGIFSFLPIAEKTHLFETCVAAAHPYTFEGAATLFQLPLQKVSSKGGWHSALTQFLTTPKSGIIEIQTERSANYQFHQELTWRAMCSQIHYTTTGDPKKQALVFLHGFLGCIQDWDEMIEHLSPYYYCVAIDLPGHGKTPFTSDACGAISSAAHHLNLNSPVLIGYSMGGRIALHLKNREPAYWKQVVALSTHPGIATNEERSIRLADDIALSMKLETEPFDQFLTTWYTQPLFASLKTRPDLFESILQRRLSADPRRLAQALRTYSLGVLSSIVSFFPNTVFLYGEEDLKYEAIYRILPPDVSVHPIAQAGHAIHLERPVLCATLIKLLLETDHANTRS